MSDSPSAEHRKIMLLCDDLIKRCDNDLGIRPFMGSQPATREAQDDIRRFVVLMIQGLISDDIRP